ncbi:hypothetical protein DITRI_Ditri20bG0128100 [Diplodiscus trichospermus]
MEEVNNGNVSPSSSPPTPPSPLPISVGPGNLKYLFSPSPTPSPPFSPPSSANASAENLPLLRRNTRSTSAQVALAFSVDRKQPDELEDESSCLKDLLPELLLGKLLLLLMQRQLHHFFALAAAAAGFVAEKMCFIFVPDRGELAYGSGEFVVLSKEVALVAAEGEAADLPISCAPGA